MSHWYIQHSTIDICSHDTQDKLDENKNKGQNLHMSTWAGFLVRQPEAVTLISTSLPEFIMLLIACPHGHPAILSSAPIYRPLGLQRFAEVEWERWGREEQIKRKWRKQRHERKKRRRKVMDCDHGGEYFCTRTHWPCTGRELISLAGSFFYFFSYPCLVGNSVTCNYITWK